MYFCASKFFSKMDYQTFLNQKRHSSQNFGIDPLWLPDKLFDYQKYVADYSIRKGRCADFLDTGTGKTIIELVVASNYVRHTNKPVLILTPLAVAFQFIREAEQFGIDDVSYSRDGKFTTKIVVANYERLHYFKESDFECVILDESSMLKDAESSNRIAVTSFLRKIKYRFLFTATPSPNDFEELGTSSEALGYLGYHDMLTKFFTNNADTISPNGIGVKWRLKGHATEAFFQWVGSWSISMRKPSDLGFDDSRFILPPLHEVDHIVENKKPLIVNGQHQLFNIVAKTRKEIAAEQRATIEGRCEKAVDLAQGHDFSVYWCNLNSEAELCRKLDSNAVELKGAMKLEEKESILIAFSQGQIKKLITKPKITCFGLNWQHCNHTVIFPGFSYEQYYQMKKRFHRFGQKRQVFVDRISSDGGQRILQAIDAKAKKADGLYQVLNKNLNTAFKIEKPEFDKPISLPSFLQK